MLNLLFTLLACFGEYSPSVSKGLISDGNIEESDSLVLDRDNDNDGFSPSEGDCDDENPLSFPEAEERCDEVDNNCNGLIDEGHNKWWYLDFDADGFGDINETHFGCVPVAGYVENPIDCNDADFFIHPDAQEACNNIDDNCDGKIDEELNFVQYFDADGDGFGDPLNVTEDCSPLPGYVGIAGDCDDGDIRVNPARPERCNNIDDNCDTLIDNDALDALPWYEDTDNDTFGNPLLVQKSCTQPDGYSSNLEDCDDSNSSINPNAAEVCNNIDDNCNTQIDDNPSDGTLYFRDADIDGFGDPNAFTNQCSLPSGYRENSDDCDDTNNAVNPNATEVCNTIDDNCNTQIDDDDPSLDLTTRSLYFRDADSDSFGAPNQTLAACAQPNGYVADNTDCNDLNPAQNPNEIERCNNIDDDCDTLIDVGATDAVFWYADTDRDNFGDANNRQKSCSAPAGFLADASDCDDTNSAVNPNATEVCNTIDDNCDSLVDVGAVDSLLWYLDSDDDGYGDPDNLERSCTPISGYKTNNDDCNDLNPSVNPAKTEICNNIDDNCDSLVDNDPINGASWYRDFDRDGFGNLNRTQKACSQPNGYVTDSTDCNDADTSINPSAPEICDNADNNCNTQIDENPVDGSTFYLDVDRDGFGDPTGSKQACSLPNGFSSDNTDCDDIDASVNPGAVEICNTIDDDCNGIPDDNATDAIRWFADDDNDGFGDISDFKITCTQPNGYIVDDGDCNDANTAINPGATEICDNIDNDCDGDIDFNSINGGIWYRDFDRDGFGNPNDSINSCVPVSGYVADNTDCNDADTSINPSAPEICDNADNNCNTQIDENPVDGSTFYLDADRDGFGDPTGSKQACSLPNGFSSDNTDCDDIDASVNPGAVEICNTIDDDCNGIPDDNATDVARWYLDSDRDGFGDNTTFLDACNRPNGYTSDNTDCNDLSDQANPQEQEVCDGIDNDCDTRIDIEAIDTIRWFRDRDGDGFGNPLRTLDSCTQPTDYVADSSDCNDNSGDINPGVGELCDGIDNDCDSQIDIGAIDAFDWYADSDRDGFGDSTARLRSCDQPQGHVPDNTDCDDSDTSVNPGAVEICNNIDDDCNGILDDSSTDALRWYPDIDGDGFGDTSAPVDSCAQPNGHVTDGSDCDDNNSAANPGATEICDTIDNDCNALADDDDPNIDPNSQTLWSIDADSDGFGDPLNAELSCIQPQGFVSDATDCDDTRALINPGRIEICDNQDNDCSGGIDDNAVDAALWFFDNDSDGFGGGDSVRSCTQPNGGLSTSSDCDDNNADVNPSVLEICNSIDDDCNGQIDDSIPTAPLWYRDDDSDGFGDVNFPQRACSVPGGHVSDNTDCDDQNTDINPTATEICDGEDNNCSGQVDEDDPDLDLSTQTTFFADLDADGFGDPNNTIEACRRPGGYTTDQSDCDDDDIDIFPGADEVCNNRDDNCNTQIDENAIDSFLWFADLDADGFGDPNNTIQSCSLPNGYTTDKNDCDDDDIDIFPGADEVCNNRDDNCNGQVDDNALDFETFYRDFDRDGFGDINNTKQDCSPPIGFVADDTDCNDQSDLFFPELGVCPLGESCLDILSFGLDNGDGIYVIDFDTSGVGVGPLQVECDMTTNGGGWTGITYPISRNFLNGDITLRRMTTGGGTPSPAPIFSEGFDFIHGPFTMDFGDQNHYYHYDFDYPPFYDQFYFDDWVVRANGGGSGNTSEIEQAFQTWAIGMDANIPLVGDIAIGSPFDIGPVASMYEAAGMTRLFDCASCELLWPSTQIYTTATASDQIRVAWGEQGAQSEGWYPWYEGTLFVR